MANELSMILQLKWAKGGVALTHSTSSPRDMAGAVLYQNVQAIGTSTEQIEFPADLTGVPGMIVLKNLNATNFIEVGLNTPVTQIFAKLMPGQIMPIPPSTATLYAKANTAACDLLVMAASA